MIRRMSSLFLVSLFALACGMAKSSRPSTIPAPGIDAGVIGTIFFGSGNSAPANVDIIATNHASVPIVLRRVQIDTPGMATYGLLRTGRTLRETIGPGQSKRITVFATAVTAVQNPGEPLTIRVIADFESGKDRWREIVTR